VVIDMMAQVTIDAQNDWTDLNIQFTILMNTDGDSTLVVPCDKALGAPPVANVMVIGGNSIPHAGNPPGTPLYGETKECCDPKKVCNDPGEIVYQPGYLIIPGNANGDSRLDIADGIYILSAVFRNGPPLPCECAGDANADGVVDGSDAVYIIYYQFLDGPEPVWGVGCQLIDMATCGDLTCEVQPQCEL